MTDSYSTPATAAFKSRAKPRWLRRALILNGVLLAILMFLALVVFCWIWLDSEWEAATTAGDPVTYQHFIWIEVQLWPAVAYFLIPNGILLAAFFAWYNRERNTGRAAA